jgi:AraC-like DNA-binding protein
VVLALGRVGRALEHDAAFSDSGAGMIAAVARHGSAADVGLALKHRHYSVADLAARCGASARTLRRLLFCQGIFA